MRLAGARVALCATSSVRKDLWLHGGRVSFSPKPCERVIDLSGFLILPGLINVHDHLELNLLPRLGDGPYPNATTWATAIYRPDQPPVCQHLAVPRSLRQRWGVIKNMLSGVTTVVNHNPQPPVHLRRTSGIRLATRFRWAHSLKFAPDWLERLYATPRHFPFIIHAAEGTDDTARREITTLEKAGALRRTTVLVHGVALQRPEITMIERSGCSIVWCPSSNLFTLGRTLSRQVLGSQIPIALGSDSAVTAKGDLLDEYRFARQMVSSERLYQMVTTDAAKMLCLPFGFGKVNEAGPADLLVVRDIGLTPSESLLRSNPEAVIAKGKLLLVSSLGKDRFKFSDLQSRLHVEGRGSYFTNQPVERMVHQTSAILQDDWRLAGKHLTV